VSHTFSVACAAAIRRRAHKEGIVRGCLHQRRPHPAHSQGRGAYAKAGSFGEVGVRWLEMRPIDWV